MGEGGNDQPLWISGDVAQSLDCHFNGAADAPLKGVSIDSRTIKDADLFFAIKGDRFDGHGFVEAALANETVYAVVSKERIAGFSSLSDRLFVVDDVLKAMEKLGRAARDRLSGKVVAVTGSVGKTGTKEMMRLAFGVLGDTHASVASFNNHWGVPLTLARTPKETAFGIYEIGMNHPGEITPLVDMVRPHVAIITTVEPVHLEFFDSEQEIARAKAEIFSGVLPGGTAVLNRDNRHFAFLQECATSAGVHIASFGEDETCQARLIDVVLHDEGSHIKADIFGKKVSYELGSPGRHLVQNSLAVAAALHLCGADVEAGLASLSVLTPQKGRGAKQTLRIDGETFTLLDESYNANPASMRAAIGLLGTAVTGEKGRRIAVLGDMLELGDESDQLHAALLEPLKAAGIDEVFLCGPHMKSLWECLPQEMRGKYADSSYGLSESLVKIVAKGDVVMIKGSLGSRMGPLVETLASHYPGNSSV